MKFRFTRHGYRPVNEVDHDYIIRDGFNACTDEVKAKLEAFFSDPKQQLVVFDFGDHTVEVSRDIK